MLELYHWEPNGSFLKPLLALHEKALPFQSRYVDLLSLQRPEGAIGLASPETRITLEGEGPILIHDGRQVSESLFIIEYLEDAFPERPLRPAEPIGQARVLAWARFINEILMPAVNTLGCHHCLAPQLKGAGGAAVQPLIGSMTMSYLQDLWRLALTHSYPPELLEESRRKVALGVARIEEALGATGWLVADAYSLADIDAFSICHALPTLLPGQVNAQLTPRLTGWLERIRSRPAVRAALATSRTGKPEQAFAPGPEHARWG
jgi:glutathione S-transferase